MACFAPSEFIKTTQNARNMKTYISIATATIFAFLLGTSCNSSDPKNELDTPTSGTIKVWADEGYEPVIKTSIDVFDSIYSRAKIADSYMSEAEAVRGLLNDSVEIIIISRTLNEKELAYFKSKGFTPEQTRIANDALAFIIHPDNKDTTFTQSILADVLSGKINKWKTINPKSKLGDIQLIFDHEGSGTVRYARDTIAKIEKMPPNTAAMKTNKEVIAYVSKNKNAIGIISTNWISDTDDKGVQSFLKEIKLLGIAKETGAEAYTPYQAYLATGDYPYRRGIFYINAQARNFGLGRGFASFLAGDKGQRIILKSGLLPATMPIRLIKPVKE
jgi:phosphate transport system substrate-binding protein